MTSVPDESPPRLSSYSRTLETPIAGEPADQPAFVPEGESQSVLVHTELGVPIYFDVTAREFSATISATTGRGETSILHSAEFAVLLRRIRERALVVPVSAYQVRIDYQAESDDGLVVVSPCTVVEYHPKRNAPFVIQVLAPERARRRGLGTAPTGRLEVQTRAVWDVCLPEPEHIEKLRQAVRAERDEDLRHRAESERLRARTRAVEREIPRVTATDVRSVQQHNRQLAAAAEAVGAAVYDADDDGDDADVQQQQEAAR